MSSLNFTLTRQQQPVTIDDEPYMLVELDGKQRDAYLNNLAKRLRTTGKGKAASQTVSDFDGLQAGLIAASLRKVEGPDMVAVPVDTIQRWPARVQQGLFDAAKALSGLDDDEGDEGND